MVLVAINCVSKQQPLDVEPVLNETAAIVVVYITIFYLMDLYNLELVSARRVLLLNMVQAGGLVCTAIGLLGILTPLLRFSPALIFPHLLLTAIFIFCARAVIDLVGHPPARIGVVAGETASRSILRLPLRRQDFQRQ